MAQNSLRKLLGVAAPQAQKPLVARKAKPNSVGQTFTERTRMTEVQPTIQRPLQGSPARKLQPMQGTRQIQPQKRYDQQQRGQTGVKSWNVKYLTSKTKPNLKGTYKGARPPAMVDVSWSDKQVPADTPEPAWYTKKMTQGKKVRNL